MKEAKMEKTYNPKDVEDRIYKMWEKGGYFAPKINTKKKPFTIILPPPNANAPLHLGHAMYTVEDTLIRWHRMLGDPTLWLPGADHAGFETQVVYEKELSKEGKSRFDYDRETLYQNIWDFVQKNKSTMENQLKRLGYSLDFSREKFTLDPDIVKTTYKTFKRLYDDGLLYRDARLVNYCTKHGTGFSDLEVEHEERDGFLYYIEFPVKGEESLIIATARPETIPGDIGVAVHPKDKRYKKYIGKIATNPVNGSSLPIVADGFVKMDFGTGVVKLTSAHDENDFDVCKKHKLPLIQVIGFDGKLTKEAGQFEGLKVLPAREKVLSYLKEKGLFKKEEPYKHAVSLCYKCGTILEPLPLPQWYIRMNDTKKSLSKVAVEKVKNGEIKIVPKRFEKVILRWLTNIKDWNISRQIVWGMRIPAWECKDCGSWVVTDGEAPVKCKCGSSNLVQDSDTFDTWFSSGQWPFSTLGYPNHPDYKYFYPTSVMETAYEIIFFWVARMIMLGVYVTGKIPFEIVYLHGLVRDPKGQKMSKSKNNVVDPMDLLDKYGADGVRMGLVMGNPAGSDQSLQEPKFIAARNFANKLWNIGRFILGKVEEFGDEAILNERADPKALKKEDQEILKKKIRLVNDASKSLKKFRLSDSLEAVYQFVWHEFADKYIESVKDRKDYEVFIPVLLEVYKDCIKLLHPFIPFVTEEIWEKVFVNEKTPLIVSLWPDRQD
ncbi:valine--tRNA ligase [candidate division WWE3 bacterium RIFCSPHIGHO2_01_FULL_40_23]|uniref:Valine--tRNA ligase n=1 Tax=candidate division WWE3 bacterium RIFCSPLOWO2_01_FULL_41_18 TaxID=1802625 RepID=A0A1F4VFK8_UNCKA|nr:MAG: valine--tRNA ligase [candidate division WWE3 bacterium RIFCSPHIGHO2_01_FULL_40_23]OGC55909.1 MAG: valine--tRNA ligase [candidate division WWE3 bacterium RIFCSPLOWO2_01_FULL_41_18]